MKSILAAGAALAMITCVLPAAAASKRPIDANHDGKVSMQELQTRKLAKLMRWDRDGDGRISRAEWQTMMARKAQRHGAAQNPGKDRFAKMDLNRDGFVTRNEIDQISAQKFARRSPDGAPIPANQMNHGSPAPH